MTELPEMVRNRSTAALSRRTVLSGGIALPIVAASGLAGSAVAQQPARRSRYLVAFFSRTGNTRVIAGQIRCAHEADLFEITPATPYPEDYQSTVDQAQQETRTGFRPALAATLPDLTTYEAVFMGFPIWGMTAPPVIRSFLSAYDLGGKNLVPFITHGGYGTGRNLSVLADHAKGARILRPFVMEADQERRTLAQVSSWLRNVKVAP
jgi:flavodoxin